MKVIALCNINHSGHWYCAGEEFSIRGDALPGLSKAVKVVDEKEEAEEAPVQKPAEKKAAPRKTAARRTRKTKA